MYRIVKAGNLDEKRDHFLTILKKRPETDLFQKIRPAYNDGISPSPVVEQKMNEGSSMKKRLSPQTVVEASSNALSDMEISTLVYSIALWVSD